MKPTTERSRNVDPLDMLPCPGGKADPSASANQGKIESKSTGNKPTLVCGAIDCLISHGERGGGHGLGYMSQKLSELGQWVVRELGA